MNIIIYLLERILLERKSSKWLEFVHRYGSPALLLAWTAVLKQQKW